MSGRLTVQAWREEQEKVRQMERERVTSEVIERIQSNLALMALTVALRPRRRRTFMQRLDRFFLG